MGRDRRAGQVRGDTTRGALTAQELRERMRARGIDESAATRTSLLVAALVAAVAATLAAVLIVLRIHDGKRRADASAQRLVAE